MLFDTERLDVAKLSFTQDANIHSIHFQFQVRVSERKQTSDLQKEGRRRLAQLKLERKYPGRSSSSTPSSSPRAGRALPSTGRLPIFPSSSSSLVTRTYFQFAMHVFLSSLLLSMALRAGGGQHAMQSPPPPPLLAAKKWISDSSVTQSFAQLSAPLPTRRRHSLWGSLGMEVRADWRCG